MRATTYVFIENKENYSCYLIWSTVLDIAEQEIDDNSVITFLFLHITCYGLSLESSRRFDIETVLMRGHNVYFDG